jgi:hypothetical protein
MTVTEVTETRPEGKDPVTCLLARSARLLRDAGLLARLARLLRDAGLLARLARLLRDAALTGRFARVYWLARLGCSAMPPWRALAAAMVRLFTSDAAPNSKAMPARPSA